MKIKNGMEMHTVLNEHVVMAAGEDSLDFNKMISLNESAAAIWSAVAGKDFTVDDMADALMAIYDVERKVAVSDCQELLERWTRAGLIDAD